jgi:hypothetical protein
MNSGDDGELRQQRRARECEEMRVSSGRGGRERESVRFIGEREGNGGSARGRGERSTVPLRGLMAAVSSHGFNGEEWGEERISDA